MNADGSETNLRTSYVAPKVGNNFSWSTSYEWSRQFSLADFDLHPGVKVPKSAGYGEFIINGIIYVRLILCGL